MFDSATPWDEHRLTHIKRLSPHGCVSIYIRGNPGGQRHASAADVKLIRSHELGIYPNWESLADFFRTNGPRQAKAAGQEAAQALHDLGMPTDGSLDVPFSYDYDMDPSTFEREAGDLVAAQEGLGGVATAVAYGPSAFITYLWNHGIAKGHVHWLMMSTFNKPYVINQPGVGVVQAHDASGNWIQDPTPVAATDINTITKPELLRAWWPDNSPFKQGAVTDVDLSNDKDVAKLKRLVQDAVFQHVVVPANDKTKTDAVEFGQAQRILLRRSGNQLTKDDVKGALAAGLKAAGISNGDNGGLTEAQLEQAAEAGLRHLLQEGVGGTNDSKPV
jgi:hypothetical protein